MPASGTSGHITQRLSAFLPAPVTTVTRPAGDPGVDVGTAFRGNLTAGGVGPSGLPYTVLRTTRFHNLLVLVLGQPARSGILLVPAGTDFQPVEVTEVAAGWWSRRWARPPGGCPTWVARRS
ncbi:hypothetical protein [Streptosporangium sp. NPDC001681]|uniref:hypothetical protein n=1 Tax=Streptosporangium sp. NPDC001681 TaxID=3154395 RepID=UPI003326A2F4